jgi:hypothetical protein
MIIRRLLLAGEEQVVELELEERRLAPLGGRSSQRSAEFTATLQDLLRHAATLEETSRRTPIEADDRSGD